MHLHPNRRPKARQLSFVERTLQSGFVNTVEFVRETARVSLSIFVVFVASFGSFVLVAGGPQEASASPMQTVANAKEVLIVVYRYQTCNDCPPRRFTANIRTRADRSQYRVARQDSLRQNTSPVQKVSARKRSSSGGLMSAIRDNI